jgi:hypothetical protein
MERYQWSRLNHLQIGRYAEYYVKMEFTMLGYDVYGAEVDDQGIDLVVRRDADRYYDIQVKAVRGLSYVFFAKTKFQLRANLYAAVAVHLDGQPPSLYLIPSLAWQQPDELLAGHDYEGKRSKPEWGLNLSHKNQHLLERFPFHEMVQGL